MRSPERATLLPTGAWVSLTAYRLILKNNGWTSTTIRKGGFENYAMEDGRMQGHLRVPVSYQKGAAIPAAMITRQIETLCNVNYLKPEQLYQSRAAQPLQNLVAELVQAAYYKPSAKTQAEEYHL